MKPHLHPLDPDFYLDLHTIALTHKYHTPKQALKIQELISDKSNEMYDLRIIIKLKTSLWIRPLILMCSKM